MNINWLEEVLKRKEELIRDTQALLRIPSVLNEEDATEEAPFGRGVYEALRFLLQRGQEEGFAVKNVDGFAGHLEIGQGDELIGVLCHVDVVPPGDGWSSDPFAAEIRDGKIYARGAIDDKGPTMAAFYAMKIVKELGLPLSKRVRMIIGTDEESEWRCVEHYFQHEEMPTMGFAPDADFPIIYAEKGIADIDLRMERTETSGDSEIRLQSFQAGRRYNMVPDFAEAVLLVHSDRQQEIARQYRQFLHDTNMNGNVVVNGNAVTLQLEGISAHAMEPENGKNAGLWLAKWLADLSQDAQAQSFIRFVTDHFFSDSRGKALGIAYSDEITGDLTVNVGILSYHEQSGGKIGINIRYPVTTDIEQMKGKLERIAAQHGFVLERFGGLKPHYVDKHHVLVRTLQRVYEEQTGEPASLLSIGGGTYARSLKAGVAFGPLFPGRPDVAHQKDEYIIIDDLLKATAIYAQAIYELAK
ncbi:dipeptidase PepV [Parageobacillus thermoglucosidasius]|uniref:Dipeptidase PepV n=2 Tax=Anoxybacillaceae TaxID=3120669 RepID=A0AAN0YS22_PARTM|nr:dipeptidase PepV [Parageobacillus thermoglucosidasius]REK59357.1 MAG: dipeptidase PepV [Geobacillus sp.]AEH46828.1 dipeptidase [Parageobacillus thermoglucosidasius C56-YS93]ALF11855.1 dipeptidase PepV [Parageobacillus thermoglucosidasius]ANZ31939.1 dipeptidase PepV [Parageobacillus thermoglucosidasius]APM82673.1 dipeptidase PepV [Parageobacillus thermoglucosidasius]